MAVPRKIRENVSKNFWENVRDERTINIETKTIVSKKQNQEKYGVTEKKLLARRTSRNIMIANVGSFLKMCLALVFNGGFR